MTKTEISACSDSFVPLFIGEESLYYDTVNFEQIYDPAAAISQVYTSNLLEIGMVIDGGGVHQIFNQALPCKKGDIYIIPQHIPHGYFASAELEKLTVRRLLINTEALLEPEMAVPGEPRFCYGVFRDNAVAGYAMLNSSTRAEVEGLFDRIVNEVSDKKQEWREAVKAYIALLLITLGRYVNSAIRNIPALPNREWRLVSATLRTVTESYTDSELTLERIAKSLYISKSHLSRVFKELSGESFSDYLRKFRMSNAAYMLRNTSLQVDEIAHKCGFKDVPTFYRNFQSEHNTTPHKYRQGVTFTAERKGTELLGELTEAIRTGAVKSVKSGVDAAIAAGLEATEILSALIDGMETVGEKFKNGELYVPEVLVSARAMNCGIQMLKPLFENEKLPAKARVCIGTVRGDLHDIGKNLVKLMLEAKGLEVIDLGTDVAPEVFIDTALEQDCPVICCSALLTITMGVMREVVELAIERGVRDKFKIMVGGAPVTAEYAEEIGADCYSPDAASAAEAAIRLLNLN